MNKKKIIIIVILIVLILFGIYMLYNTFAINSYISSNNDIYNITLTEDNNTVTVPSNSNKTVYYHVKNTNRAAVKYAVGYTSSNVDVAVYEDTNDKVEDIIDYGYATDLSECSKTLHNYGDYDTSTGSYPCRSNDWLYYIFKTGGSKWLLSPYSNGAYNTLYMQSSGTVDYTVYYVSSGYAIFPTLYLSSDQCIVSGDGSQGNPYQLNP